MAVLAAQDSVDSPKKNFKIVVVGDGAVGKTCFCMMYAKNEFPTEYTATVFDSYPTDMTLSDGTELKVNIWDTAGQEEFENLRKLTYPETNLFMVCFSMDNRASFENVRNVWLPDLAGRAGKVPKMLVGTKKDLVAGRQSSIRRTATSTVKQAPPPNKTEIDKLVKEGKLMGFMGVSAKTDAPSVTEAFETGARLAINGPDTPPSKNPLLDCLPDDCLPKSCSIS